MTTRRLVAAPIREAAAVSHAERAAELQTQ
jgi:hypothetical protein